MLRILPALAVLTILALPRTGSAAALPEDQVKAAFIFNFLLFTNWPDSSGPLPLLRLCTYGDDGVARALRDLDGRRLGNGSVTVSRVSQPDALSTCHALYLGGSEQRHWQEWQLPAQVQGTLTVTDSGERLSISTSVLVVAVENDRVVFSIDQLAAQRHRLSFSARILQLAQQAAPP